MLVKPKETVFESWALLNRDRTCDLIASEMLLPLSCLDSKVTTIVTIGIKLITF